MQKNGAQAYHTVNIQAEVMSASPHRLIQLLFEEEERQLNIAIHAIEVNDIPLKCKAISKALDIIITLRASLNKDVDELSENLDNLYDFIERHLVKANLRNSITHLEEVNKLISNIHDAWNSITPNSQSITMSEK